MTTITPTAPEINVPQKPAERQKAIINSPGTDPGGNTYEDVSKALNSPNADQDSNTYEEVSGSDSQVKNERSVQEDSKSVQEDSKTELPDSQQGEDAQKPDLPLSEAFLLAALTEKPDTAGTSADVETLQTKNNPQIIKLPATAGQGQRNETNQSQEGTTVLSLLKEQEGAVNTPAENEGIEEAFREVGKGGKEIKNFLPNNLEKAAGENIHKNQTDISVKNSDQTGRISEIENTTLGNGSTITSGGQKPADKAFLETVQRPSGFSEVLDKIVYVVKNNRSMDVSVLHEGNRLNINLTMDKGMLNVHINTNEAAMKELIENNIRNLVDNLEQDGVNISEFSVNLKDKRDDHKREETFNHDMPVRGFTPPAYMRSVSSGTGAVNIFV